MCRLEYCIPAVGLRSLATQEKRVRVETQSTTALVDVVEITKMFACVLLATWQGKIVILFYPGQQVGGGVLLFSGSHKPVLLHGGTDAAVLSVLS